MKKTRFTHTTKTIFFVLLGSAIALLVLLGSVGGAPGSPVGQLASRLGLAPVAAAQAEEEPRIGFDPLSIAEQSRAQQIALEHGGQGSEVLLVERHEEDKSVYERGEWPRRADVFAYNYERDTLIQTIVNLSAGVVDSQEELRDVQLPLTESEAVRAVEIVLADPEAGMLLREQYHEITGSELTGPDQLGRTVLVFRADVLTEPPSEELALCGEHRCGELILTTLNDELLDVSPIVDLSRGIVVRVRQ